MESLGVNGIGLWKPRRLLMLRCSSSPKMHAFGILLEVVTPQLVRGVRQSFWRGSTSQPTRHRTCIWLTVRTPEPQRTFRLIVSLSMCRFTPCDGENRSLIFVARSSFVSRLKTVSPACAIPTNGLITRKISLSGNTSPSQLSWWSVVGRLFCRFFFLKLLSSFQEDA